MMIRWVVGVALLFGVLLVMLPDTGEKSRAKMTSTAMLMCTMHYRQQVGKQILRGEPVTARFKNTCPALIAHLKVDKDGRIAITGKKYNLRMVLTADVKGDKVRWSCRGEPAAHISKLCKP